MCKILNISRGSIYYISSKKIKDTKLENEIISIFKRSRNNYGTRKIKVELEKQGIIVSRRKIKVIMNQYGLISNYTTKQFKPYKTKYNNEKIDNIVAREFNSKAKSEVIVSDLTYVNVSGKWNYICLLIDLFNREIIGYATSQNKDSQLVLKAFSRVKIPLNDISIFHTDRGNEFKNNSIELILETFKIKRSLSKKGCPYDNAVAESMYKILKTEFINNKIFNSLEELETSLFDYINWYNNYRIHSSLNYVSPVEFRNNVREKIV